MSKLYKKTHKLYPAWNYQKEIEDLNRASEQGWQLLRGGCFHSKFVKNPDVCYRYQLDFRKVEDLPRYIETFREQGWEYVNSTFNGWHYFRKLYDPTAPAEAYEIFTDRESLHEMNSRWARIALCVGIPAGLFAILCVVRMFLYPHLPVLTELLTFVVESAIMIRGGLLMRNPDASRNRRGAGTLFVVFFAVILLGCTASLVFTELRPDFSSQQNADSLSEPIVDNRWVDFDIRYRDNYFLDLDVDAKSPLTFSIVDADGNTVYTKTGKTVNEEDVRIKLNRGHYEFSISCDDGFSVDCSLY